MAFVFLSYRPGEDSGYLEALFRELRDAIRPLEPPGRRTEYFVASGDAAGSGAWTRQTAAALARCTVFIAICSERYFLTDRCGREWSVFQRRLGEHEAATGRRPQALIPLAWGSTVDRGALPGREFVSGLGLEQDVRPLARLNAEPGRYHALIHRLARHIVDTSRDDPLARTAGRFSYATTANAFESLLLGALARTMQSVKFVITAAARGQLTGIRHLPHSTRALAEIARAVATDQMFRCEVVEDPGVAAGLLEPGSPGEAPMIVLLVGPGSVRVVGYREALNAAPALRLSPPESTDFFANELGEILERIRGLSYRTAPVRRTAPGSPVAARPILEAP